MVLVFLNVRDSYGKHKNEVGYARGVSESIGHPMKYSEVPIGEYTVVAVVDKYKPYTAVVRRDSRAVGYVAPEYFFVTDMMPNMMPNVPPPTSMMTRQTEPHEASSSHRAMRSISRPLARCASSTS